MNQHASPHINKSKKTIAFSIQNTCADHICLAGTFNGWAQNAVMRKTKNGLFKIEIPLPPKGKYYYKFIIDDRMWVEDVDNPLREPDGVAGWNSVLTV
jgi:1,4-alpha-glucan branching enzyme